MYLIGLSGLPFFNPKGVQPMANMEGGQAEPIPNLAFTVTDTHLIFGFESSVEKALGTNKDGGAVTSTRWFNQAREALPDSVGAVSLEDARATTEFFWWLLKETQADPGNAANAAATASYLIHDFDMNWSLLPEFEKVNKYFGIGISYLISRDDGFYIELRNLDQK